MTEQLHFRIEGEFITNLARERFYQDHNLSGAIELVQSATVTDELNEVEHLMLALEVISGKKSIIGTYPGDDYGIKENNDIDRYFDDFIKEIDNIQKRLKDKEEELQQVYNKYSFVLSQLPDYKIKDINDEYHSEYGEYLFEIPREERRFNYLMNNYVGVSQHSAQEALDEFLARRKDTTEYKYADYGWLEPDGTYHEVEWGMHSQWARDYLDEHYPFKEYAHMYWKTDSNGERHHYVNGDCLVHCLGWVLLDNPMQGIATPKYDPIKGMTKAQKEFLFDYYIDRGMNDRASGLYKEDDI